VRLIYTHRAQESNSTNKHKVRCEILFVIWVGNTYFHKKSQRQIWWTGSCEKILRYLCQNNCFTLHNLSRLVLCSQEEDVTHNREKGDTTCSLPLPGDTPFMEGYIALCAALEGMVFEQFWPVWKRLRYVFHSGLALGILIKRNYFSPHPHWHIRSPFQSFTQMEAVYGYSRVLILEA